MDGIETLKNIRKSEEYRTLPVVMLTSSQMENDIIQSYQVGANAFVVKPIDFNELIKAIRIIGSFWITLNTAPIKL